MIKSTDATRNQLLAASWRLEKSEKKANPAAIFGDQVTISVNTDEKVSAALLWFQETKELS